MNRRMFLGTIATAVGAAKLIKPAPRVMTPEEIKTYAAPFLGDHVKTTINLGEKQYNLGFRITEAMLEDDVYKMNSYLSRATFNVITGRAVP